MGTCTNGLFSILFFLAPLFSTTARTRYTCVLCLVPVDMVCPFQGAMPKGTRDTTHTHSTPESQSCLSLASTNAHLFLPPNMKPYPIVHTLRGIRGKVLETEPDSEAYLPNHLAQHPNGLYLWCPDRYCCRGDGS